MKGIITSITYRAEYNDKYKRKQTFVDLFLRCSNAKREKVSFLGFPHFYIREKDFHYLDKLPDEWKAKVQIRGPNNVHSLNDIRLSTGELVVQDWMIRSKAYEDHENLIRIDIPTPGDCPPIRDRLQSMKDTSGRYLKTYEADVLYVNRWLIDAGLKLGVETINSEIYPCDDFYIKPRYWIIDIEALIETEEKIVIEGPEPIIVIGVYDSYDRKYYIFYLGQEEIIKEKNATYIPCFNEVFLLQSFYELLQEKDPDILMGFNLQDYDLPKIVHRSKHLGVNPTQLSPIGHLSRRRSSYGTPRVKIQGREIIDLYEIARFLLGSELREHNLDYVNRVLGHGKGKLDLGGHINELWDTDRFKVLRYNKRDLDCVLEVELEQDLVRYFDEVRKLAGCLYNDILYATAMYRTYIMRRLDGKLILKTRKRAKGEYKYPGAFVKEPVSGLYFNVLVLDFSSLYPNVFITFNIGYKSYNPRKGDVHIYSIVEDLEAKDKIKQNLKKIKKLQKQIKKAKQTKLKGTPEEKPLDVNEAEKKIKKLEKATSKLKETREVSHYYSSDAEEMLPELLEELLVKRAETKEKIRNAKSQAEIDVYSKQDQAFKVIVNSAYGVMGKRGFVLFKEGIGESVCVAVRLILEYAMKKAIEYGFDVIYGDTDSLFIALGKDFTGDPIAVGKDLAKRITEELLNDIAVMFGRDGKAAKLKKVPIKMDMETVYESLAIWKKKNYLGKLLWTKGQYRTDSYQWKGMGAIRSDSSILVRDLQRLLGKSLVDGEEWDQRQAYLDTLRNNLVQRKVTLKQIGSPTQLRKSLSDYKVNQPHVKGAKYSNEHFGTRYRKGSKPMWAYVKSPPEYPKTDAISFTQDTRVPKGFKPDLQKTTKRLIQPVINAFLSLAGEEYKIPLDSLKPGVFILETYNNDS